MLLTAAIIAPAKMPYEYGEMCKTNLVQGLTTYK